MLPMLHSQAQAPACGLHCLDPPGGTLDLTAASCAGARAIHDHAYRWPMFSPIPAPVSYGPEDIAIFTLSKLTGRPLVSKVTHGLACMPVGPVHAMNTKLQNARSQGMRPAGC